MNPSRSIPRVSCYVGCSLLLAVSVLACTSGAPVPATAEPHPPSADGRVVTDVIALDAVIPDVNQPRPGLYSAGQPAVAAWQPVARSGVTTVINLRPPAEMAGRDEAAEVASAGLKYFELPVAGAADITMANAMALQRLIDESSGPVLVHCASGNRVGALLALGEVARGGLSQEEALAFGRSAGLGSLEARVREVMQSEHTSGCQADASC